MTSRRWVGGVLVGALLPLAGCADDDEPQDRAAPSAATSSAATEEPTREELAGEAAAEALQEFLQVADEARQEPSAADWEPAIRRYAADPAAHLAVRSVREYATLGLRQSGRTQIDLDVTDVQLAAPEGPSVRITGCYDSTSTQVVDVGTGEQVPPATSPRYVWDITVVQYESEPEAPWLVTEVEPLTDQPC